MRDAWGMLQASLAAELVVGAGVCSGSWNTPAQPTGAARLAVSSRGARNTGVTLRARMLGPLSKVKGITALSFSFNFLWLLGRTW